MKAFKFWLTLCLLMVATPLYAGVTDFDSVRTTAKTGDTYQLEVKNSSGTSKFSVDSSGNVTAAGTLSVTGAATLGGGGTLTSPTITAPTISGGATLSGTFSGGTFESGTHTSPVLNTPSTIYGVTAHAITALEDWVMSTAEEKTTYLIVTSGSGTASTVNIKGTATQGQRFVVRNASNNSVIILKSGGTGVTIASSATAAVFAYGDDYLRETADATH
jgi:hypothetical protein